MFVEAWVNEAGPFNFIVDTGASMTVVSAAVAKAAGIVKPGREAKAMAAKGTLKASIIRLKSLRLSSVETRNLHAAVVDLKHLKKTMKIEVDGIIGYNVLRRYRLTIDFKRRSLWLR